MSLSKEDFKNWTIIKYLIRLKMDGSMACLCNEYFWNRTITKFLNWLEMNVPMQSHTSNDLPISTSLDSFSLSSFSSPPCLLLPHEQSATIPLYNPVKAYTRHKVEPSVLLPRVHTRNIDTVIRFRFKCALFFSCYCCGVS